MTRVEFIVAYSDHTWVSMFKYIDTSCLVAPVNDETLITDLRADLAEKHLNISYIGVVETVEDEECCPCCMESF